MPFKSAKQERFMFAKHPKIAKRWVHKYGHAPGLRAKAAARVQRRMKGRK